MGVLVQRVHRHHDVTAIAGYSMNMWPEQSCCRYPNACSRTESYLYDPVSSMLGQAVGAQCPTFHATVCTEVCRFILLVLLVLLARGEELSVQHIVQPLVKLRSLPSSPMGVTARSPTTCTAVLNMENRVNLTEMSRNRQRTTTICANTCTRTAGSQQRHYKQPKA